MTIIPDSITPKVGWRGWRVDGGTLHSPTFDEKWPAGAPMKASCWSIMRGSMWLYVRPYAGTSFDFEKGEYRVSLAPRDQNGVPTPNGPQIVVTRPIAWPQAKNLYEHTTSPSDSCGCGIYATTNIQEADNYGDVLGRVALWGRVVEHSSGYRGEFAYPQALYTSKKRLAILRIALRGYGIPILDRSELNIPSAPATPDTCAQCGHERHMHGDNEFGCLRCPIKRHLGWWIRHSCEFVEPVSA